MDTTPNFTIINIFIISATVLGFIYSFFFLLKVEEKETSKYLIYTILLLSIYNLYYWFIDTKLWLIYDWKHYKLHFFISWELLMLPMYFFFVASYLRKKEKIKLIFIIPFLITLFIHILINIFSHLDDSFFYNNRFLINNYDRLLNLFSPLFSIFLVFKIFKLIFNYENKKRNYIRKEILQETKWLKQLLYLTLFLCVISIAVVSYNIKNFDNKLKDDFVWVILSIILYWLCFAGIYHVGIFNQRKEIRKNLAPDTNKVPKITTNRFLEIDTFIKSNKLYLNPNLTLTSLSEIFELSEGYLSKIVNTNTNTNFSTYINNLRVKESKLLITNPNYKNYTIIAIALESGFNSKSVFYNAFKKTTGISPSQYKKEHQNLS